MNKARNNTANTWDRNNRMDLGGIAPDTTGGDRINGINGDRINGTNGDHINGTNGDRINGTNGDRMNGTNGDRRNGTNGDRINGNGNGRTGGRNPNGAALSGSLADQIRALCFVKVELELYLDTHPGCRTALDYYYQTVDELKRLTEQYENTTGPLTAKGNVSTEHWDWIDGPWPWQQAGDFMRERDR